MNPRHGTRSRYDYGKCRCLPCTEANAAAKARHDARRRSGPTPEHVHGSLNGYTNYGCRCAPCRTARRVYADLEAQLTRRVRRG